jgi:hypothetical protein
MQILNEKDPIGLHCGVHDLKGGDLLVWMVAAILDQDVDRADLLGDPSEEIPVRLVADENLDAWFLPLLTAGQDINSEDARPRTEVITPHLQ